MNSPRKKQRLLQALLPTDDAILTQLDDSDLDISDGEDGEGDIVKEAEMEILDEADEEEIGDREGGLYDILGNLSDDTDQDPDYEPEDEDEPSTSKPKKRKVSKTLGNNPDGRKGKKSKNPAEKPLVWIEAAFQPEPLELSGPAYLPIESLGWDSFKYIEQYIDDDIFQLIVDKTNQTHVHKTGKPLLNLLDFKIWLGASFVMSTLQYPQLRMYWMKKFKVSLISNAISREKYLLIRRSLKLVFDQDISDETRQSDRLWKVRPLVERIRAGCLAQIRSKHISIDEMMIPFSGQTSLRQYVPNKPNPLGLKAFVLANPNGIVCDFEIYQGANTFPNERNAGFSLCESAVICLTRSLVPGHTIYFDRYFATFKLSLELLDRGLRSTSTIMSNRIANNPLRPEKEMKKLSRGSVDVKVTEDKNLCILKWMDNKPVLMLSSNDGVDPVNIVKRWSKTEKKYIMVSQPNVIKAYNTNMGGVDLADRMLSYCSSRQRTRKWTIRTIMHFFDLAVSNAWLSYREDQVKFGTPIKKVTQLRKYKLELGEYLIESSSIPSETEDSEWSPEEEVEVDPGTQRKKQSTKELPSKRFRSHGNHLPCVTGGKQSRCRKPKCSKKTSVFCQRCKIYLCLTADRNCYATFHE